MKPLLNPDLQLLNADLPLPVKSIGRKPFTFKGSIGRRKGGGRKPVEFNLPEAIRLRSLGWTNRRIAWELKCGSEETVRLRLAKFQQAPAIVAAAPEPPAVEPPSPLANAPAQMPVQTPELAQPSPVIPQPSPAATIPTPSPEVEPPPIEDNALQLLHRHPWLTEVDGGKFWGRDFFLVNGVNPLNLQYCTNNCQHAVSIVRWDESYRRLEVFQRAEHIWCILDPNDSNEVFLQSLVADLWVREKSAVTVCSALDIAKYMVDARVGRLGVRGVRISLEAFETIWKFIQMPSPNHVEIIRKLLEKPEAAKLTPLPQSFGTSESWMSGGGGGYQAPSSDFEPKITSGGGNPNDGSGFAF